MHEAALMRDLVRRIEAVAREEGGRRVVAVRVWLGALSHFTPVHFREHLIDATVGTLAEGARVEAETSDDIEHPDAAGVRLLSVEVAT